jgi:hypothetical protein
VGLMLRKRLSGPKQSEKGFWEPFAVLCPGEVCSAFDPQGRPLYFDADHLSHVGNRVLEASFTEALRQAVTGVR